MTPFLIAILSTLPWYVYYHCILQLYINIEHIYKCVSLLA